MSDTLTGVFCLAARATIAVAMILAAVAGCRGANGVRERDADADVDADVDTDTDADTDTGTDTGVQWIMIPGGTYLMGDPDGDSGSWSYPVHEVSVTEFQIARTEVTVAQYQECVEAGACSPPGTGGDCTYNNPSDDSGSRPANCLDWYEVHEFCDWIGARLPSEAEWEYAARSGGQQAKFPWGDGDPSCEYAVFNETGCTLDHCDGCGEGWVWPVCSKPKGRTVHGLCDMIGNVSEWVEDDWHENYEGAPLDGSAWIDESREGMRVHRGGDYTIVIPCTDSNDRSRTSPIVSHQSIGFRPARSMP